MDTLTLNISPELWVSWPTGGGFQQVEVLINGVPLIELVRDVELPFAEAEFDRRIAEGEAHDDVGPRGRLAGDYLYLPPDLVGTPGGNLYGQPWKHGFNRAPNDPANQKSLMLQCTCGIAECWFLLARIEVRTDVVVWSDFEQFHRDWTYDLGPFAFDRNQYEAVLESLSCAEPEWGIEALARKYRE